MKRSNTILTFVVVLLIADLIAIGIVWGLGYPVMSFLALEVETSWIRQSLIWVPLGLLLILAVYPLFQKHPRSHTKKSRPMKKGYLIEVIFYSSLALSAWWFGVENLYVSIILGIFLGIAITFLVIAPMIQLFRGGLTNSTIRPKSLAFYTEIVPNQTKMLMRGGETVELLRGGKDGEDNTPSMTEAPTLTWGIYKWYIYKLLGLHPLIPFVHYIWTYPLPRYDVFEEDGKTIFKAIPEDDPRFYSDHLRTAQFTWYFEFKGAEVSTIPMTVKGSAQVLIRKKREEAALFRTVAWNVLLDQALKSVIRGVIRANVTLDQVIGHIAQDIWDDGRDKDTSGVYNVVQDKIMEGLKNYRINGRGSKLTSVGIEIRRIDIIDFEPEIEDEKRIAQLQAHALERQVARGRSAAGQGEAEYQAKILAIAKDMGDTGTQNIWAQAMAKAAEGGNLDALAAGLLKRVVERDK